MIERVYLKNHPLFGDLELKFAPGLSVFTGVSGAGKSVLMSAILSAFGLKESDAKSVEADVEFDFDMSEFGIENEGVNTFKFVREKSSRFFINNQSVSKRNLSAISASHIRYLGVWSNNEFSNSNILGLLDRLIVKNEPKFAEILARFGTEFAEFETVKFELQKISEEESRVEELKEFTKFEIEKIESVSPKIGEFAELMQTKKLLSKRDKIISAWDSAARVFEFEQSVCNALNISEIDSAFFIDCMNELREKRENLSLDELDEIDVEKVLNRIEALNSLIKRYGTEENALETLEKKKAELKHYNELSFEKSELERKFNEKNAQVSELANKISEKRAKFAPKFEQILNKYLEQLYMEKISLEFAQIPLNSLGFDEAKISVSNTALKNLSSGEINRLKLAFIASDAEITEIGNGVIILDEIDANLSGKEAMSIAEVLLKIAKFYQIFAISHQPQLSSKAQNHYLIVKNGNTSSVKKIKESERIAELARMISGAQVSKEATEFAKKLMNSD